MLIRRVVEQRVIKCATGSDVAGASLRGGSRDLIDLCPRPQSKQIVFYKRYPCRGRGCGDERGLVTKVIFWQFFFIFICFFLCYHYISWCCQWWLEVLRTGYPTPRSNQFGKKKTILKLLLIEVDHQNIIRKQNNIKKTFFFKKNVNSTLKIKKIKILQLRIFV